MKIYFFASAIGFFPPKATQVGGKIILVSGYFVKNINIGDLFILIHADKQFSKKKFLFMFETW